jgi:hypothetical protein
MTEAEREWCVQEANWAGEGYYNRKELEDMDDRGLCASVLNAWSMYVQSHY